MDPESFDWSNYESIFVQDVIYENINAPQWIDLSEPDQPVDDEAWFCNPDCQHPRTLKDFRKSTRNSKLKLLRSATTSGILPFRDRNCKGINSSSANEICSSRSMKNNKLNFQNQLNEESENQNPSLLTPPTNTKSRSKKAMIVSSNENKKQLNYTPINSLQSDRKPKLSSAFSARNLFAGKEILNQITEFCSELKNLVTKNPVAEKKGTADKIDVVVFIDLKDRERVPLLGVKETEL